MGSAVDRVRYILQFAQEHGLQIVQTTSFGIDSALMLQVLAFATSDHASSSAAAPAAKVPIIFIDTGYLPKETYQFAQDLKERFSLDLRIYQSDLSPARLEAIYGRLWEDESDHAHQLYNTLRKVIPMQAALDDLGAHIILKGLRAAQTKHRRENLSFVTVEVDHSTDPSASIDVATAAAPRPRFKVCPLLDWEDEQVRDFFQHHQLPYHPLYAKGYRTVGDWHSSQPYDPIKHQNIRDSRFHGRVQECGLHVSISNPSLAAATAQGPTSIIRPRSSSSPPGLDSTVHGSDTSNNSISNSDHGLSLTLTNHGNDHDKGFVIYGRPKCKYCRAAKALLQKVVDSGGGSGGMEPPGTSIVEIEVGRDITKEDLWILLGDDTVQTVPQILYRGYHIGGYRDLCQWGLQQYDPVTFRALCDAVPVDEECL